MSFEIENEVYPSDLAAEVATSTPVAPASEGSSLHVSTENIIYRTYGKYDDKGLPTETAVRRQSADGKVWEALEKAGKVRLSENTYTWYTVLDEAGFAELVSDPEQRLAIINKGINALQTAAANQTQIDFDEKTGVFTTNDALIDLKEAINEAVSKRGQNPMQKATGMLKTLSKDQQAQMLAALMAMMNA